MKKVSFLNNKKKIAEKTIILVDEKKYSILTTPFLPSSSQLATITPLFLHFMQKKRRLRVWKQIHGGELDVQLLKIESTVGEMFWNK